MELIEQLREEIYFIVEGPVIRLCELADQLENEIAQHITDNTELLEAVERGNNDNMELVKQLQQSQAKRDALVDCLQEIEQWCNAYPLTVFPEPDLKKAHELLKAGGITLDAVSASAMRHVLNGIVEIIEATQKEGE